MSDLTIAGLTGPQKNSVKLKTAAALSGMTNSLTIADFSAVLTLGMVAAAADISLKGTKGFVAVIPPVTPPTAALISFFTTQSALA